jgi:hypothetical protein
VFRYRCELIPVFTFFQLGLIEALCRAIPAPVPEPTPLQAMAIPALIEGRDLITLAPNGTGKKVAWALAMLQRLCVPMVPAAPGAPRGLVLVCGAEHAVAAGRHLDALTRYVPIEHAIAGAGASRALRTGLEVLIATPQQALDLHAQGLLSFAAIEFVVVHQHQYVVARACDVDLQQRGRSADRVLERWDRVFGEAGRWPAAMRRDDGAAILAQAIEEGADVCWRQNFHGCWSCVVCDVCWRIARNQRERADQQKPPHTRFALKNAMVRSSAVAASAAS